MINLFFLFSFFFIPFLHLWCIYSFVLLPLSWWIKIILAKGIYLTKPRIGIFGFVRVVSHLSGHLWKPILRLQIHLRSNTVNLQKFDVCDNLKQITEYYVLKSVATVVTPHWLPQDLSVTWAYYVDVLFPVNNWSFKQL